MSSSSRPRPPHEDGSGTQSFLFRRAKMAKETGRKLLWYSVQARCTVYCLHSSLHIPCFVAQVLKQGLSVLPQANAQVVLPPQPATQLLYVKSVASQLFWQPILKSKQHPGLHGNQGLSGFLDGSGCLGLVDVDPEPGEMSSLLLLPPPPPLLLLPLSCFQMV